MQKISHGVWECRVEGVKKFDMYKFRIETKDGRELYKIDPFAFHAQTRPESASKVYDIHSYAWTDKKWLAKRKKNLPYSSPINIYELQPDYTYKVVNCFHNIRKDMDSCLLLA